VLGWRPGLPGACALGERTTMADLGATLAAFFDMTLPAGRSFLGELR
jgi:phosphopentomutase